LIVKRPVLENLGIDSLWQPALSGKEGGPLLVFLHGRGDSAQGWADFQAELELKDLSVLLLNAPDPYDLGFSWYGPAPDQLPGILRSRELLERAFGELHAQGFGPERCILGGFSQGCLMTVEFGARYPEALAGYLGLSGYCYDPEALLREASPAARAGKWLITHGTEDDVLPIEATRAQVERLKEAGLPLDYREYAMAHTLDTERELPEVRDWLASLAVFRR
jgi:phospholipase/carboxylesterase